MPGVTINTLLRAAVGAAASIVVLAFGLNAVDAWRSYQTAVKISRVAEITDALFVALPNLRADRNNTGRDHRSEGAIGVSRRVADARAAAAPALERAVTLLRGLSYDDGERQTAVLAETVGRWSALHPRLDEQLTKPMSARSTSDLSEFLAVTTALIEQSDRVTLAAARSVRFEDAMVEKLFDIKNAVWETRVAVGDIAGQLTGATIGLGFPKEGVVRVSEARGRAEAGWRITRNLLVDMDPPPRLTNALGDAEKAFFTVESRRQIESWVAEASATGVLGVSNDAYDAHMTPRLAKVVAVADVALDLAKEKAAASRDDAFRRLWTNAAILVVVTAFAAALFVIIGRRVTAPLAVVRDRMLQLAGGDLSTEVPYAERSDEIGALGAAMATFKRNMVEAERLRCRSAEHERHAAENRRSEMRALADRFERAIGAIVGMVASAATELRASAETLTSSAEETSLRSATVAAASEEASANVASVAGATEELSSSVAEISRQIGRSATIAHKAVDEAAQTNEQVEGLAVAVGRIGSIVELIDSIAGQTNLLALNATIEAARAGDAGKGFAVVAAEVKLLADQTATATAEISTQIGSIQGATDRAATAIGAIGRTIEEMNRITSAIASAVDGQGAATDEIARNVQEASRGTSDVSAGIADVSRAATGSSAAASQVLASASELSRQAETLRGEVDGFLATVRAE